MFASLLQFIRVKTRARAALVVGTVAAATLALAGGALASGLVLGHGSASSSSSLTSSAKLGSQDSQGSQAAGDASGALGPNGQTGTPSDPTHRQGGKTTCPSGSVPASGSTVNGGLIVDGLCKVNNVTINGGVLIKGTGHLCLSGSLVNGGMSIQPNGDLDSNFSELGCVASGPNRIHGGVTADHPFNIDIIGDTIEGAAKFNGMFSAGPVFFFCGVTLQGDLMIQNLPTVAPPLSDFEIGDPGGEGFGCDGNTIAGSVHVIDSPGSRVEVEANTIEGSLLIANSTLSATGNTIGGSLQCHQSGKLVVIDADDTNTNTVGGANHC